MTYKLQADSSASAGRPASETGGQNDGDSITRPKPPGRLASLDAYRGFIMVMLAASGFGFSRLARTEADSPLWSIVNRQTIERVAFHFDHPPWQSSVVPGASQAGTGSPWLRVGVSFWDLIQPAFMFMVGVAMPFSYARREGLGQPDWKRTAHAFVRAVVLVLMGVFLASLWEPSTNWFFTNVLAQIGLGYFFAYLLLGRPRWVQWTALMVILVGTWIGIHVFPQPENYRPEEVGASYERGEVFAEPYRQWSKNGNAFHAFDVWFLNLFPRPEGKPFVYSSGGYQTLNFVPSIATMLLGVLCGQLLLSPLPPKRKLGWLLLAAAICWGLGVLAGATCCPVIKRIWTPSWVLFSGGYVIGLLALFYLVFDILPLKKLAFPLMVVGMNSIAVYMMGQMLRGWFVANIVHKHFSWGVEGLLGLLAVRLNWLDKLGVSAADAGPATYAVLQPVVDSLSALLVIWLITYWMFRQKVFIRV